MATPSNSVLGKIKAAFLAFASTGLSVVEKVLPFISPFLPKAIVTDVETGISDLTAIATVITDIEAIKASVGGLTPAQALAAAQPKVEQIIQTWLASGLPGAGKVIDRAGFESGVAQMTSAMVAILNSVGE
ncbi:MAG: hypothetical protein KGL39_15930 [Patescibacteria group bacterium]|nr:hypothetical protein [Patescibacteria group bacterium]